MPDADARLLAAVYRRFGFPAVYAAPGTGGQTACRIQLVRAGRPSATTPYQPLMIGAADLAIASLVLLVRASEVAEPQAGGVFTLVDGSRAFTVGDAPLPHDADDAEWECNVSTGDVA